MDVSLVLADLRTRHGDTSVLYAADIARETGKALSTTYELMKSGALPFKIELVGGRSAASIYAVAEWLAGGSKKIDEKPGKSESTKNADIPPPARKRQSLKQIIMLARIQKQFQDEFLLELEKMEIEESSKKTELTNADLGRGTTL
jgi:predicted DNA-binding transcriptional regulator AlpA